MMAYKRRDYDEMISAELQQQQQHDHKRFISSPPMMTVVSPSSYQQSQSPTSAVTTTTTTTSSTIEEEMAQKSMQHVFEKKRRRRESHNAVERRRRDNINERIFELATLLPDSREAVKSNKGTVLKKSVDHIRLLHDKLLQHQQRVQELESMLQVYSSRNSHHNVRMNSASQHNHHSGHVTLDLSAIQPH